MTDLNALTATEMIAAVRSGKATCEAKAPWAKVVEVSGAKAN